MRSKSPFTILGPIVLLFLVASSSLSQDMQTASAGNVSLQLPSDWQVTSIPERILSQSTQTNSMGLPAVSVNLGPEPSGKTFDELIQENRGGASRSKEGDRHIFNELDHEAGRAFTYERITTTRSGKEQAVRNTYVEAGGRVWMLSWTQMANDDVSVFEDLWRTVAASLRAQ